MKKFFLLILLQILISFPVFSNEIKDLSDGNKDAKIKVLVFESLTCSYCAKFHEDIYPKLKSEFVDSGKIEVIFKSFPLDLAALNASKLSYCKNDGKTEVLGLLYKKQNEWIQGEKLEDYNKNLKEILKANNIKLNFEECLNSKDLEDFILNQRITGSKKYKINATPTIVINGQKFDKSLNFKNLKKELEKLL